MNDGVESRFALPRHSHPSWWIWVVACVVHIPFLMLLITEHRALVRDVESLGVPVVLAPPVQQVPMVYRPGPRARRTAPPVAAVPRVRAPSPGASGAGVTLPADRLAPVAPGGTGLAQGGTPDSGSGRMAAAGDAFRPKYGTGALWVQPMPMTTQEMASRLSGKSMAEITDSAVTAIVQGYLDRMAEERPQSGTLPSWTTTIAGKKVGLDSRWIYLGPLKIPTALLTLLPIRVQSNPTEADFSRRLNAMREDLFDAARRSANYDEFKKAVQELRDETQRKRDFERNRRTAPDSGHTR